MTLPAGVPGQKGALGPTELPLPAAPPVALQAQVPLSTPPRSAPLQMSSVILWGSTGWGETMLNTTAVFAMHAQLGAKSHGKWSCCRLHLLQLHGALSLRCGDKIVSLLSCTHMMLTRWSIAADASLRRAHKFHHCYALCMCCCPAASPPAPTLQFLMTHVSVATSWPAGLSAVRLVGAVPCRVLALV